MYKSVQVLINNAAITCENRTLNDDGIEMMFAVNVLSYQRLITGLCECKIPGSDDYFSRIINVASHFCGQFDINDLEWTKRKYHVTRSYQQNKLCNRMISVYAASLYKPLNIASYKLLNCSKNYV